VPVKRAKQNPAWLLPLLAKIPWWAYAGVAGGGTLLAAREVKRKNQIAESSSNLELTAGGRTISSRCTGLYCNDGDVQAWAQALSRELLDLEAVTARCGDLLGRPVGPGDVAYEKLKRLTEDADKIIPGATLEMLRLGDVPLFGTSASDAVDRLANLAEEVAGARSSLATACRRDATPMSPTNSQQPPPSEERPGWVVPAVAAVAVAAGAFSLVAFQRRRSGPRMTGVPLPQVAPRYR